MLLLSIHVGAALLTVFFQTPWAIKFGLLVLLLISMMMSLYNSGWISVPLLGRRWPFRWQFLPSLTWQSDNDWRISTRSGEEVLAQLLPGSTCHPSFVALNFRTERDNWMDRYISVVIVGDAVEREIFRQLRVRLRTRFVQAQDN
jgi:hypothetical protein